MNNQRNNPLLGPSSAPFGAPEFDKIAMEDYLPAFESAIKSAKEEIDRICADEAEPDFENTIEALEYAGMQLDNVSGVFFNLNEADSDEQMQEIADAVSPMLTEYSMYVSLNAPLFDRVKSVYEKRNSLGLDSVQVKLVEETYKGFIRGGSGLDDKDKEEFASLTEALSLDELKFGNNVLSATNAFFLHLTRSADLEGLPEYLRVAAAEAAKEKGLDGWVFTLHYPSYAPFMKFSSKRELRKQMYLAYNTRAVKSNEPVISSIMKARARLAGLLGFDTYADYALEPRMARTRSVAENFLHDLTVKTLPFALDEMAGLQAFAEKILGAFEDGSSEIMPWDFAYFAEKLRAEKYELKEEDLKPYFELDSCIGAVFGLASRLYGLTFEERKDVPVYHDDVRVYDVKDADGSHLALFYADFFPRTTKRGGAWMTEFRGQFQYGGTDYRPFISIVTNFSKPAGDMPSLLTHDELTTFLHEFGHALHGILSKGKYPSMCGTNVARDFVELPSQIMEHWAFEPEFLNTFARHYITGETIPDEYVARIVAARNFMSGYYQIRQLQFGLVDMAWHTKNEWPAMSEVENAVLDTCRTLPSVDGTSISAAFGHIFSGGYAAGYYSYKWAEVLETDAFAIFKENGIFDKTTADRFRHEVLEKGSSEDEAVLYRNFRGRDPEPSALMESLGLVKR